MKTKFDLFDFTSFFAWTFLNFLSKIIIQELRTFIFQKPRSKKKPFIATKGLNKEDHQTFAVIHRSQQDPLVADSDAPQRLLQPLPSKDEAKKRKQEERDFGVFYDDEYDYMQHMKSKEEFNQYEFEQIELVQSSEQKSSSTGRVKYFILF